MTIVSYSAVVAGAADGNLRTAVAVMDSADKVVAKPRFEDLDYCSIVDLVVAVDVEGSAGVVGVDAEGHGERHSGEELGQGRPYGC